MATPTREMMARLLRAEQANKARMYARLCAGIDPGQLISSPVHRLLGSDDRRATTSRESSWQTKKFYAPMPEISTVVYDLVSVDFARESMEALSVAWSRAFYPIPLQACERLEPLPETVAHDIPDDTACTMDEWNAKVDALLASCALIEQEMSE